MNALLLALGLLAATGPAGTPPSSLATGVPAAPSAPSAPARIGSTPAAVGAPRFVQVVDVDGLPADSLARRDFMDAFRGVFAEDALKAEHGSPGGDGGWMPTVDIPNRFRLLEGSPADDAWTLQVVVGAPVAAAQAPARNPRPGDPPRRRDTAKRGSRGMILSITAMSPEAIRNGARLVPQIFGFAFPAPPPPADASQPVNSSGFKYSWAAAGKVSALLALETLHHFSGDLKDDERFDVAPAVRTPTGR